MREHERQTVSDMPGLDELQKRAKQGWKLVAIEWEREISTRAQPSGGLIEIPFGLRVSDDGFHLEEDPRERAAILLVLSAIVDDRPLSHAVVELNRQGYLMRNGREWTATAVFELLPRLIEASPTIFSSPDWEAYRARRARAV